MTRLLVLAVLGGPAVGVTLGQDSTSTAAGTGGDAVNAYLTGSTGEQVNDYTLRLSPKPSSWGRSFSFGPLAKASRTSSFTTFNHVLLAQTASGDLIGAPFLRSSYADWTGPGFGVGASGNTAPGSASGAGVFGYQFACAFAELGQGGDGVLATDDDDQHIVTQIVNFALADPSRLYVSRINALSNKVSTGPVATASLGLGGVDAAGNLHAYADGYGLSTATRLADRELVRVQSTLRSTAAVNGLSSAGFADSAASLRVFQTTTGALGVPSMMPTSIAGGAGRPVLLATDLASNLLYEGSAGVTTSTKGYLPSGGAPGEAVRGSMTFVPQTFPLLTSPSGVGVCASLARTDGNTTTRGVQLWGANSNGAPAGKLLLQLPTNAAQLTDPLDGFSPGTAFPPLSSHEFANYGSQLLFRGGAAPVACVVLPGGDLLAAALTSPQAGGKTPQSLDNAIVVARVTPAGVVSWSVAAHTGDAAGSAGGLSKAILGDGGTDGIPGNGDSGDGDGVVDATPIGRIAKGTEVFALAATGPSISSPAFDRAGNLYFVASVALNASTGTQYTTALIRGNRDSGTGGYKLEVLLKLGDVIAGQNSQRNYQVQSLALADGDSGESGSIFSTNTVGGLLPGVALSGTGAAASDSPVTLSGLIFRARIVYDVNQDGQYVDPSLMVGSSSTDQAYNVAMIVMPSLKASDVDRSGAVSVNDLFTFLALWFAQNGQSGPGLLADFSGDGLVSVNDLFTFLSAWFAGN